MKAIKAHFDGRQIIIPTEFKNLPPSDIILVYPNGEVTNRAWLQASESAFAQTWDNEADAVYDTL